MSDLISWAEIASLASVATVVVGALAIRQRDRQHYDTLVANQSKELINQARDLADFKLHVATAHPTMRELSFLEERVVAKLDYLTDRLDRLLDRDPA